MIFCGVAAIGQENSTAPSRPSTGKSAPASPEVESALRARVARFYQAHVDGKFRLADQVVADDSKDAFFAVPKQRYAKFDIVRLNFKDDFRKAEAVVNCLGDWMVRGQKLRVNMVQTSLWKLEDGEWWWYMLPPGEMQTPFGTMFKGARQGDTEVAEQGGKTVIPRDPQAAAAAILTAVKADKQELMLSSFEKSAGEIKIRNGLSGPIHVRADIDERFPGLTFQLDKPEIEGGGEGKLTITCDPQDRQPKPTLVARIFIEETNQVLSVKLMFSVPPEIEKLIPKELRPQKNP